MALHKADIATLQMALVGYEMEKGKIEEKIREIHAQLRGKKVAAAAPAAAGKTRGRHMSAAGRARIAAAQKKRWAEHRKRLAGGKA